MIKRTLILLLALFLLAACRSTDEPDGFLNSYTKTGYEEPLIIRETHYVNEFINFNLVYDDTWYLTDRTHEGLQVINESKVNDDFSTIQTKLKSPIPVADFTSSDKEKLVVRIMLYPKDSRDVYSVVPNLFYDKAEISNVGKPVNWEGGQNKPWKSVIPVTDFTMKYLDEEYVGSQMTYNVGENTILLQAKYKGPVEEFKLFKDDLIMLLKSFYITELTTTSDTETGYES